MTKEFAIEPMDRVPDAILIGGSAGAIEVVSRLLSGLLRDFSIPIIIVIHLPRHRPSALADALSGYCRLPLHEAQDKEPLAPGTVYLAVPDYHLLLDRGPALALSVEEPVNYSQPSIDVLFESAAAVLGARCSGVIVSGANADGARGLRAIQQAGGAAIVQAPEEATQIAMPRAAMAACPFARVLTVEGIGRWIHALSLHTTVRRGAR